MTAKRKRRVPSLRHHRASGQGFVELNGRRVYLGRFGLPQTKASYDRVVGEWLANGRQLAIPADEITIGELVPRFWRHVKAYYVKNGRPTSEREAFRQVVRIVRRLYGPLPAARFGPRQLRAVRRKMIRRGWCRSGVNRGVGRIKYAFKWAVAHELIEPAVLQRLQAVEGLKRGRSKVRESEPVRPVPAAHIDAIEPHVSRQVWALVQLQRLTGARAGELVKLRPMDLDTTGPVWTYAPAEHKTQHHGRQRVICIGSHGQAVIEPFLAGRAVDAFLFSPTEAEAERRAALHGTRETPLSHGNRPGTNRKRSPKRKPGDCYTVTSYRRGIERGCKLAKVPAWSPHRLRHTAATEIRKVFGLEAAQIMLGHAKVDVTQLYAEINRAKAVEVAAKIG